MSRRNILLFFVTMPRLSTHWEAGAGNASSNASLLLCNFQRNKGQRYCYNSKIKFFIFDFSFLGAEPFALSAFRNKRVISNVIVTTIFCFIVINLESSLGDKPKDCLSIFLLCLFFRARRVFPPYRNRRYTYAVHTYLSMIVRALGYCCKSELIARTASPGDLKFVETTCWRS